VGAKAGLGNQLTFSLPLPSSKDKELERRRRKKSSLAREGLQSFRTRKDKRRETERGGGERTEKLVNELFFVICCPRLGVL
jgi:hypothetical protein